MDSSQSSQSTDLTHEYDEDYFLAQQLEREERDIRRREEENNLLAAAKILDQEKKIAGRRKQSQFEENSKLELKLQNQWIFEYEQQYSLQDEIKYSSFVSYSLLLQELQEQEESWKVVQQLQTMKKLQTMKHLQQAHQEKKSLKVAQQFQAEEEEHQRYKQMRQENNDKRMAFKMILRAAMMEESSPAATTIQSSRYVARLQEPNESSLKRCNSCHPLTSSQKDDEKIASRSHVGERIKMVAARMFKDHLRSESKAKQKGSKKGWRFFRNLQRSTSTAAIITPPSLLFTRSMQL